MADKLFDQLGLNKREAKDLVEGFLNVYATHWKMASKSNCQDLGNFDLRDKNQRPGRNPKTGEEIPISARRVVTFRPGQKLKTKVIYTVEKKNS